MNDTARVRGGQGRGHLYRDVDGLCNPEGPTRDPLAQRFAFDVLADDEWTSVDLAKIMDDEDIRVID